jgi:hypothetical protein
MSDTNLPVLNKFLELYRQLIHHDGYGDIQVKVRKIQGGAKEVVLLSGKEYRFQVDNRKSARHYKAIGVRESRHPYRGPERRSSERCRRQEDRRLQGGPRNFKLERRLEGDRRKGKRRRWDD